jgi:hypothetical protein
VTTDALAALFADVLAGRYPESDGGFDVIAPDATTGLHAVLSFTGHAVVATDRPADEVAALGLDGYGGAHHPDVLRALAGPGGWIGVLDLMLWAEATGVGGTTLERTTAHDGHHRVRYARDSRIDVQVWADERGLVTVGRGLGGRTEIGIELHDEAPHGQGHGRAMWRDVLAELPPGPVWASCAPGNARSVRALLAAGFQAVGAEVLLRPLAPTSLDDPESPA